MNLKKITTLILCIVLALPASALNYDFSDKAQEEFEMADDMYIPSYNEESVQTNLPKNAKSMQKTLSGNAVYIGAGAALDVALVSPVSSDSIQKNDRITAQLNSDWISNNVLIAPQGSTVSGTVTDARSASWLMQNGQIGINFNQLTTPSGKVVQLATNKVFIVADSNRAAQIAKRTAIGLASGLLFAGIAIACGSDPQTSLTAGAITGTAGGLIASGAKKGEEINIPEGTSLNVILSEPMTAVPYN